MERVPSFVKNMAKMAILRYAQDRGHTVISSSIVDEAMETLMPQAAKQAMSAGLYGRLEKAEEEILWEEDAQRELRKIADPSVREQVKLRVEKSVKIKGLRHVTREDIL